MINDLTIIFLTVNKVPKQWAEYHKKVLLEAIGDMPVITIAREKLDWGHINLVQEGEIGDNQIYTQMLRGAKLAKTPYIAMAEDDTLYPKEHFIQFRPQLDEFAYNNARWGLFAWGEPMYHWRHRIVNSTFIGPVELTIKALEERYEKYPDGTPEFLAGELGRPIVERRLGLPSYKLVEFYSTVAIIDIPPLRERKEDISALCQRFLETNSKRMEKPVAHLHPSVYHLFQSYSWPGNVRELENTIEHALIVSKSDEIQLKDLPPKFQRMGKRDNGTLIEGDLPLEEIEKKYILLIYEKTGKNKKRAAEILKLSRTTLISRLKSYGVK